MLIPFDELFARYNIQADGVLHLGANTGQEAEAYYKQGIKQVIWVEAMPNLCALLRANVAKYPFNFVLEACVSDVDGKEVVFNVASNGGQSSSFLPFGTHSKEHPTVHFVRSVEMNTVRVDTLLERTGLKERVKTGRWFLNADLQGVELLALKGMGALLLNFDWAYIEVNERELYKGCALVREVDEYLLSFGLASVVCKMTGAGWGDKLYKRI